MFHSTFHVLFEQYPLLLQEFRSDISQIFPRHDKTKKKKNKSKKTLRKILRR